MTFAKKNVDFSIMFLIKKLCVIHYGTNFRNVMVKGVIMHRLPMFWPRVLVLAAGSKSAGGGRWSKVHLMELSTLVATAATGEFHINIRRSARLRRCCA